MSPRTRRRSSSSSRRRSTRKARGRWRWIAIAAIAVAVAGGAATGNLGPLTDLLPDSHNDGEGVDRGGASGEDVDADRARERLAELRVAESSGMTGYSRDRFPHWRTVDGCDVRQTVLARDGERTETEADSCRVVSGSWFSPFDQESFTDPGDVDIDHIVPLANAWRTGAAEWDDDQRAEFANDLDAPQLIAVSASSNRAKGDQDPSQWRPDRDYWCRYAHDWVVVKHAWQLSVTEQEQQALVDMLDTCD